MAQDPVTLDLVVVGYDGGGRDMVVVAAVVKTNLGGKGERTFCK